MTPHTDKAPSRKNFILLSAAAFFSAALLKFIPTIRRKQTETVKMLTQDGILVEVDKNMPGRAVKKINDSELKQWVKK